jgi:nitrogen PTS system EIIA component
MNITDFLSPQHAIVDLRATDQAQLLHELTRRAAAALGLPADQISDALLKREALGSTGTGGGIAIPHARLPGVSKP